MHLDWPIEAENVVVQDLTPEPARSDEALDDIEAVLVEIKK